MKGRVHSRCVFDIATGLLLEDEFELYDGPWALLKESAADKQARAQANALNAQAMSNYINVDAPFQRQMAAQNAAQNAAMIGVYQRQIASEEAATNKYIAMATQQFNTQTQMAKDALAKQYGIIDPVVAAMKPYMAGDKGFTPDQMKFMNDQSMQDIAGGYSDASGNTRAALLSRGGGGDMPMGGDYTRGIAELEGGLANQTSNARRQINLDNVKQMLMNQFNAASVTMGAGGQVGSNYGTATGAGSNALGQVGQGVTNIQSASPVIQSTQGPGGPQFMPQPQPAPPGFWSGFGNKLLGLGATAGVGALAGGISSLFTRKPAYSGGGYGGYF